MPLEKQQYPEMDHSVGASEVIGAVLLISVVVAAIALVTVFLFSQVAPQKVPNVNFMTGTDSSGNLYLYHNGGDSLNQGDFSVLVDNTNTAYKISDQSTVWSLGKNLVITGVNPSTAHSIAIVYNGSATGPVVIRSSSSSRASLQTNINPDVIVTTTTAPSAVGYVFNDIANISNSSFFIPAIQQNVTSTSISYWKAQISTVSPSLNTSSCGGSIVGMTCVGLCYCNGDNKNQQVYYYTFMVNDNLGPNTITYGTSMTQTTFTTVSLKQGDVVNVSLSGGNVNNFGTFGIAPGIWELTAYPATLNITFANGTPYTDPAGYARQQDIAITHTRIGNYTNLHSTLMIDPGSKSANAVDTGLIVNGTQIINGGNSTEILLMNVRPLPVGLYTIFSGGSGNQLYFVGQADKITFDGVTKAFL